MKYIKEADLLDYLRSELTGSRRDLKRLLAQPVTCLADAQDMANAISEQQAQERTLTDVAIWAKRNAVEGALVLNPWGPDGGGVPGKR